MVTGKTEKILPGGESLVRVGDTSVLVANAVPGDVVRLQVQPRRRGVLRGDIVEVIEASAKRVSPPCPVAGACGGCALQFISHEDQAAVKSGWVSGAFKPLTDTDTAWLAACSSASRYRRRVRWFVGTEQKKQFLGFYAPVSHRVIRHAGYMVITPALNALRQWVETHVPLSDINSVQAIQLSDGIHIVLETDSCPANIQFDQMEELPLQWWWRDSQRITRPLQKPVQSFHDLLPAGQGDISLMIGPDDFVQGEARGNRELIAQIQAWAGSVSRIADLFCGIGNLSLPLAAATGADVFGAELNAASVRAAAHNAKTLAVSAQFVVANLFEDFDKEPYIGADVLILDPPRRGAKRLCNQMSQLLPKKIIMISCDTAAGARDGALLQQHGYRLKALRALDLFPGAGHVETMSLWGMSR